MIKIFRLKAFYRSININKINQNKFAGSAYKN